ncbi:efflux RND transporter periplasmic adaptor subunit [Kangiella sp. M94]
MKAVQKTLMVALVSALLGASAVWLLSSNNETISTASNDERKPIYWVAPMDANYKRDKPGKSPMGMDLIPVYESGSDNGEVGTVLISPEVTNNLGVRTATVQSGRLSLNVQTVGYVQYNENKLVHISPRVEGWVEKLYVRAIGDPVKAGEPLYSLYSPTLVNAQEELLLASKRGNQVLINAAVQRLLALQVAQADIDRLRKTRKVTQTITITAPQSGVLDSLAVREGMFINPGMSLMSIGQLEHLWVIGEVFERQASLVQEGDQVSLWLDYLPGREWTGQVDYVYPSLNTKTRTAQVRVQVNNSDTLLKPGMFAQMEINTRKGSEALLIPREALIRTGGQARVVLALGDGKFKSVAVDVGREGVRKLEITSGLNAGERIVTSAQFLIDSESSKTSDFMRMTQQDSGANKEANTEVNSVWTEAQVESLMPGHRMITLKHEAIPDWKWPAMTMDFNIATGVDIDTLKQGMRLHVKLTKYSSDDYRLTEIQILDQEATEDSNPIEMNHSQHKGMSHGETPILESNQHENMNHDNHEQKGQYHD